MRNELRVADDIRAALGAATVRKLHDQLVPVDCLTCGEEIIDTDALNLAIDDVNAGLFATLHHEECRPSAWAHHTPEQAQHLKVNLTWRARVLEWEEVTPVLIVNPSCEAAVLFRSDPPIRAWTIGTLNRCAGAGFVPAHGLSQRRTVEGLRARLEPTRLTVLAESGPLEGTSWHAEISDAGLSRVRAAGSVVVAVTTGLDPKGAPVTPALLAELSNNDDVLYSVAPIEQPTPKLDPERLLPVIELVRRGMGSVPSDEHLAMTLLLYQHGTTQGAMPRPKGNDLLVVVSLLAGVCYGSDGALHVLTDDHRTARRVLDACRKVFGKGGAAVSRFGEPSFTSERRISVGTYEEVAAARRRFDNGRRPSADHLPVALAVDPVPDSERAVVRSRYSRLIEM
ncbi:MULTISPECIES: hypothetical protein [unclassified Streptomyces]|uniref:hypothetical protein n=1 Tax=unclassified Streptomyces TaxID=2593676 RepID=UPI00278C04A0|nr:MULTISPECIES: hypothetical protein [unclassified Streptomyces]